MKQIFLASTFFELVCLAAGIDSGAYDSVAAPSLLGTGGVDPDAEQQDRSRERILLVSNNTAMLELARPLVSTPGAETLLSRFDRVVDLNDSVAPAHPSNWSPANNDLRMVEAHLRQLWGLGSDRVELVLESPQVNPAIALGRVFSSATIRVHADGLMSYGPTRNKIPLTNGQRCSTLHYLPLVPGLKPRLLAEFGIIPQVLDPQHFRAVITEVGNDTADSLDEELSAEVESGPWALAVGQYLSALGLISEGEETSLHIEMIRQAVVRGLRHVVFKPHPAAPPARLGPLFAEAEKSGIRLTVLESPVLAEVVLDRLRPDLVIGGFSTALATARAIYGIPALAVGSERLLEEISPYQNSNRIPLTIIAETCTGDPLPTRSDLTGDTDPSDPSVLSDQSADHDVDDLQKLVDSVSYCMAAEVSRYLRPTAHEFLSTLVGAGDEQRIRRYFKRRRLNSLNLPSTESDAPAPRRLIRRTGQLAVEAAKRQQKRLAGRLR